MKNLFTILILSFFCINMLVAQAPAKISGKVLDSETNEVLFGANIQVKGTSVGTTTDKDGKFLLNLEEEKIVLIISFVGYRTKELAIGRENQFLTIRLEPVAVLGSEVVISASRVEEDIRKAPVSIQKISQREIQSAASGDYFESLSNLKDVEIINNSIGYKIFNTRGFNSTSPLRVVQYIDGVDNQLPTINIVPGNMFGTNDLDIVDIEVISGPASALYGPNAMQGVLSYKTRDPYEHEGLVAKVKGGSQEYLEGQFVYSNAMGKNKKWGIKLGASYMQAEDWPADDPSVNLYGNQPSPPVNIFGIIQSMSDGGNPAATEFLSYLENNPTANPGARQFVMPGYMETDLWDGKIKNMKFNGQLSYKFTKDIKATYVYRYSTGTSVYMGNNRAPLDGFYQQLNLFKLEGKHLSLKAYHSNDNTNNTYTMNGTGTLLGFAGLQGVAGAYTMAYMNQMKELSNGYTDPVTEQMILQASGNALENANGNWLQVGSDAFNTAFESITTKNPPAGSHYSAKSTITHIEGNFNKDYEFIDVFAGVAYRSMSVNSNGTVFSDTNGKIVTDEWGGFAQGIVKLLDNNLRIIGSFRGDKHQNYDFQFSPRLAVVYSLKNHNFRISGQSAYRSPAMSDQYQYLNKGREITIGNINGVGNAYTASSVRQFLPPNGSMDPSVLQTTYVDPVKPEQLQTIEFGYNSVIADKLGIEFSLYFNSYSDFIVYKSVSVPKSGTAGEESGVEDLTGGNYWNYAVSTNSKTDVDATGAAIALNYRINNKFRVYTNYTYAKLGEIDESSDDVIPGFNTPEHKVNVGVVGDKVYKGLGFTANFRYADEYYWESVFASGNVPSYNTMDVQLNYAFPGIHSVLRVGGSNIFNTKYIQAYGMPRIGAFYYVSWTFDVQFD